MTCKCRLCLPLVLALLVGAISVRSQSGPDLGVPSTTGLVVSVQAIASQIGAATLSRGGNAVDAAVATAFALAVTHPTAGNIGGGGFMLVRQPSGEAVTFDFREKAPLKSTRNMYLDASGNIDRTLTAAGYLAPGVPGTIRGLQLAYKRFGRLPWREVVMPAVELAEAGFPISEALAKSLNREVEGPMSRFPASVKAYGKPGGGRWAAGDTIVLRDLGKSLRAIATEGADVFYKGWIADRIAEAMKANHGLITKEDLANYQAKSRKPVEGTYRGYEIVSMGPPSSGGVALIEMLNILENFDLRGGRGRFAPETVHLMIEAMRRAFLDRARYLGDPDFVRVPMTRLTSKEYARSLAAGIDRKKASKSVEIGKDLIRLAAAPESEDTTHFSVLDKNGMAVALTFTLEGGYGSHVVVEGAGFLLNNEMGDFNRKAGETNEGGDIGTGSNLILPGKRMLSSMAPTMVSRGKKLVLVTGSPGGRTIINTVLSVVLGLVEFGMNGRQAVDLPRMHHQWLPDSTTFEEGSVTAELLERLRGMGHDVKIEGKQGDAHSIFIDLVTGVAYGVADERSADSKAVRSGQ
jgi:gamma-glutamyltranspeptidase / glutathione hydrolase